MQSMLFGLPLDARTCCITGAVLVALIDAATLLPAKRAASIEPMSARRSE
jgi:ABC-type lipoprotein release transport system permease subunit